MAGLVELLREIGMKPCLCMACKHQEEHGACSVCRCGNSAAVDRRARRLLLERVGVLGATWLEEYESIDLASHLAGVYERAALAYLEAP